MVLSVVPGKLVPASVEQVCAFPCVFGLSCKAPLPPLLRQWHLPTLRISHPAPCYACKGKSYATYSALHVTSPCVCASQAPTVSLFLPRLPLAVRAFGRPRRKSSACYPLKILLQFSSTVLSFS